MPVDAKQQDAQEARESKVSLFDFIAIIGLVVNIIIAAFLLVYYFFF